MEPVNFSFQRHGGACTITKAGVPTGTVHLTVDAVGLQHEQIQAYLEYSCSMTSKALVALALIQESKSLAEAVGLAKDAALTGHVFALTTPSES